MTRFPSRRELWLTGAALVAALVIPCMLTAGSTTAVMKAVALSAVTVGVVHLGIFAWMRWRCGQVQQRTLAEIKVALTAQINSQLTVILATTGSENSQNRNQAIEAAAAEISTALQQLSPESVAQWYQHHGEALAAARAQGLGGRR